ncbi:MAG: hypothetical protein K2W99_00925 [Chthoniobacterales bacterium]|nr:hypothetical protein [Chthoniobacterales bacterium]
MRNCHSWTVREEDGVKREIRVTKQASRWRFQSKRADATIWTYYTKPLAQDLSSFIEVLERKYQRRRAAHHDILLAQQMLAEVKAS